MGTEDVDVDGAGVASPGPTVDRAAHDSPATTSLAFREAQKEDFWENQR